MKRKRRKEQEWTGAKRRMKSIGLDRLTNGRTDWKNNSWREASSAEEVNRRFLKQNNRENILFPFLLSLRNGSYFSSTAGKAYLNLVWKKNTFLTNVLQAKEKFSLIAISSY